MAACLGSVDLQGGRRRRGRRRPRLELPQRRPTDTDGTGVIDLSVDGPGNYYVSMFCCGGYVELSPRVLVTVAPHPMSMTVSVQSGYATSFVANTAIPVSFSGGSQESDWIGMYELGDIPGDSRVHQRVCRQPRLVVPPVRERCRHRPVDADAPGRLLPRDARRWRIRRVVTARADHCDLQRGYGPVRCRPRIVLQPVPPVRNEVRSTARSMYRTTLLKINVSLMYLRYPYIYEAWLWSCQHRRDSSESALLVRSLARAALTSACVRTLGRRLRASSASPKSPRFPARQPCCSGARRWSPGRRRQPAPRTASQRFRSALP